jgi:nuclear transport factor 2 (NTF2) superfamily protein
VSRKWVLDTETKGTGAQMVPLEKAHAGGEARAPVVVRDREPRTAKAPEQKVPRRYKVTDVLTRQTLAEDVDLRRAVAALEGARSVVDVNVYVWRDEDGSWYQLSQGDRRRLWALRGRGGGGSADA